MKKETVIKSLNGLPDKFDLDELFEKLLFMEKVEKGIQQLDTGKIKSHAEVKKAARLLKDL
jgi:hypothetical protein